jgi:hypothetical protein
MTSDCAWRIGSPGGGYADCAAYGDYSQFRSEAIQHLSLNILTCRSFGMQEVGEEKGASTEADRGSQKSSVTTCTPSSKSAKYETPMDHKDSSKGTY